MQTVLKENLICLVESNGRLGRSDQSRTRPVRTSLRKWPGHWKPALLAARGKSGPDRRPSRYPVERT